MKVTGKIFRWMRENERKEGIMRERGTARSGNAAPWKKKRASERTDGREGDRGKKKKDRYQNTSGCSRGRRWGRERAKKYVERTGEDNKRASCEKRGGSVRKGCRARKTQSKENAE